MSVKEEISKAIGAHGIWKTRLKRAIDTRQSELTVEKTQTDNGCEFGKWLYGVGAPLNKSAEWHDVHRLHAEFHGVAAKTLSAALAGKSAEARAMVDDGGAFTKASDALTRAMMSWERKL